MFFLLFLFGLVLRRIFEPHSRALGLCEILVDLDNRRDHVRAHVINAVCEQILIVVELAEDGDGYDALNLVRAVVINLVEEIEELSHLLRVVLFYDLDNHGSGVVLEEILGQELAVGLNILSVFVAQLGIDNAQAVCECVRVIARLAALCRSFRYGVGSFTFSYRLCRSCQLSSISSAYSSEINLMSLSSAVSTSSREWAIFAKSVSFAPSFCAQSRAILLS